MPAEPKDRQMMSFRTWCLAILPGAFGTPSHGGLGHPPGHHMDNCVGAHRDRSSRIPTATRTASSSSLRPQIAIGRSRSQSPLCGTTEAKNLAFCDGSAKNPRYVHGHFGVLTCPRRIVYRATELEVAQLKWPSMTDKESSNIITTIIQHYVTTVT